MNRVYQRAVSQIQTYWGSLNRKYAFIGVSGGKDSAVCLKLMADALGSENVFALRMPYEDDGKTDGYDYDMMNFAGIPLGHRFTVEIGGPCGMILSSFPGYNPQAVINIQPRMRMTALYGACQTCGNGLVVNTSNLDEILMGYSTLWGDSAGDFAPLRDVHVSEVIELGRAAGIPDVYLTVPPSDGLTGSTDEENLGFSYKEVEDLFETLREHETSDYPYSPDTYMSILGRADIFSGDWMTDVQKRIVARYRANSFKTRMIHLPSCRLKEDLDRVRKEAPVRGVDNEYVADPEHLKVDVKPRLFLISKEDIDHWEALMKKDKVDLDVEGLPKGQCVERWTIDFGDGMQADLKVCTSDDDVWSEMVWFKDGTEVSHTDVCDSLVGEWLYLDDPRYSVNVAALTVTNGQKEEAGNGNN